MTTGIPLPTNQEDQCVTLSMHEVPPPPDVSRHRALAGDELPMTAPVEGKIDAEGDELPGERRRQWLKLFLGGFWRRDDQFWDEE